jgi:hypothetical protein
MPWFRKDVKFKVISPEEKHEEAKSEPIPESKPAEVKSEKEPLDMVQLETLKTQWSKSPMEHVALRCPNAMKVQQSKGQSEGSNAFQSYLDHILNPEGRLCAHTHPR